MVKKRNPIKITFFSVCFVLTSSIHLIFSLQSDKLRDHRTSLQSEIQQKVKATAAKHRTSLFCCAVLMLLLVIFSLSFSSSAQSIKSEFNDNCTLKIFAFMQTHSRKNKILLECFCTFLKLDIYRNLKKFVSSLITSINSTCLNLSVLL